LAAIQVIVADTNNHRIRIILVANSAVTTLAGSGQQGYVEGAGATAKFKGPSAVAVDPQVADRLLFGMHICLVFCPNISLDIFQIFL
jgi:hypothetical protein